MEKCTLQVDCVTINIEEHAGCSRTDEPVRLGVPLPRGFLTDVTHLRMQSDKGTVMPIEGRALDFWPDGSARWVLLDFPVTVAAGSHAAYRVFTDSINPSPQPETTVRILSSPSERELSVDTGVAVFTISRDTLKPIVSVRIHNSEILAPEGSVIQLLDGEGREVPARIDTISVEESGKFRSTVTLGGRFVSLTNRIFCNFLARLTFFAGLRVVRVEFELHNPRAALHPGGLWDLGDPGSIHFKDLSLSLASAGAAQSIDWKAEKNGPKGNTHERHWLLYQDSSGGKNWNSTNHLDRTGQLTVSFPGYRITQSGPNGQDPIAEGLRATPYARLTTSGGWLAATVQDFWQNFPKSLRVDDGRLSIGIFPVESTSGFELQPGEKKRHTILLDFGPPGADSIIPHFQYPVHAFPDPEWIERSQAVSYFVPVSKDSNHKYLSYIAHVVEGPDSFFERREIIDEYGWRNFGDLYADHEAVNHRGPGKFISHYNNQYDFIYGAAVHYLRSGDRRWLELMRDAARHTVDIDIYHTDEDKPAYSHGFFWHTDHYRDAGTCTHRTFSRKILPDVPAGNYGGGPCNEHNYTSGLLHYYYLTGDPEARDAVIELAEWVISMDDGSRTLFGLIDDGPTGLASSTADTSYHGPGRGPGNSINALLDAYRLTDARRFLAKAEELIQRCIHPKDDIETLKFDDPEHRWSYLVFLQVLGKYLDFKAGLGEVDYYFHYARESLLHYADWMVGSEVPYKDVLHKVDIPTETWPAQDIRKCHVMHLAGKYGPLSRKVNYTERAQFFFDRCLDDLMSFDTAYLTRPLVILTVYGFVHSYFQAAEHSFGCEARAYDFGSPVPFLPQKRRLRTSAARKARVLGGTARTIFSTSMNGMQKRIGSLLKNK
ncbi:MAG: hypothetical protein ABFD98_06090 [Syntrophobacteraceae bacterium]